MGRLPEKILLATDGSEDAALALRAAADLCGRAGSELHVAHVWRDFSPHSHPGADPSDDPGLHESEGREVLSGQLEEAEALGAKVAGAHLRGGQPVGAICELVGELGIGLVVVGSRGLGTIGRLLMGSVSEGVVDLASCPVLVARGGAGAWPPSRMVVGDDSSAGAKEAGRLAAGIAGLLGARTLLVRAYPVVLDATEAARLAEDVAVPLRVAMRRHELSLGVRARALEKETGHRPRVRVVEGEPASVILGTAEEGEGPSLVAVGRRGLGRLERLRLGSVSAKVLRAAGGPVLIVPP